MFATTVLFRDISHSKVDEDFPYEEREIRAQST